VHWSNIKLTFFVPLQNLSIIIAISAFAQLLLLSLSLQLTLTFVPYLPSSFEAPTTAKRGAARKSFFVEEMFIELR